MRWYTKWEKHLSSGYYYRLLEKGFFADKPDELEPDIGPFEFYFDAFKELGSCRVSGMVTGPIPFTAIIEYSRIYLLTDFEEFRTIIRRMDDFFLTNEGEKTKKKAANGGSGNQEHKDLR